MSDKVYTSNFTGAEIDEAVGKVINNEIGGDAIKEGSIPLSALDDKSNMHLKSWGMHDYVGKLGEGVTQLPHNYYKCVIYNDYKKEINTLMAGDSIVIQNVPKVMVKYDGSIVTLDDSDNVYSNRQIFVYKSIETINNAYLPDIETPTPDWNAREGEAGYIENKPFYDNISNIESIDFTGNNKYYFYHNSLDGAMSLPKDRYLMYNEVLTGTATGEKIIVKVSDLKAGDTLSVADPLGIYNVAYEVLDTDPEGFNAQIGCYSDGPSNAELNQLYNFQVCDYNTITLNEKYLPNTVLKTTPQTLSDSDKNQVKQNLGISTPDWSAKEGEAGYIENRPFYGGNVIRTVGSGVITSPTSFTINDYYLAKIGSFRYYNSDGEYTNIDFDLHTSFNSTITGDGFEMRIYYSINYPNAFIEFGELTLNGGWVQFFVDEYDMLKLLEDKYIPSTIARQSEITRLENNIAEHVNLIEITYEELVNIRSNSALTPGRFYRITDYITTATTQIDTQSAGHPFDVIVLALSEVELSEQAWVIQSARDTDGYFVGSNLNAWKIWYSLDNDTSRFYWADEANGKGVIYRMIDEFNNDVPYDFKNIKFDGKFTFNNNGADGSLWGRCIYNVIRPYTWPQGVQVLNKNIFDASGSEPIRGNILEEDCFENTFGEDIVWNRIGSSSFRNTFGSNIKHNTIGTGFTNNKLGDDVHHSNFGTNCENNTFGSYLYYIQVGAYCKHNLLASYSKYVIFEPAVHYAKLKASGGSETNMIQNYKITSGIQFAEPTDIEGISRNNAYQTTIALDLEGNIKHLPTIEAPTPNWNAREGEAGYIENRTHYFEINYNDSLPSLETVNEGTYLYNDLVNHGREDFDNTVLAQIYDNLNHIVFHSTEDIICTDNNTNTNFTLKILDTETPFSVRVFDKKRYNEFDVNLFKHINEDGDTIHYVDIYSIDANHDTIKQTVDECICLLENLSDVVIDTLDDIFIPNTVLKTTPQTLSDDDKNQVKENLGISTPNWNAREGEAGYIENKPFGISHIEDTHFGNDEWQTYEDIYLYVAKRSHNDAYLNGSGYIRLYSDMSHTFDIDGGGGSITVHNDSGFLRIVSQDYFDTEEQAAEFLNNVLKVVTFKELNNVFIEDTVVKTTPQNLEVEEMYQALANLGIDPVVWRYMRNPYKIMIESDYLPSGQTIPDDLLALLRKDPYVIALNCIVLYKIDTKNYYKPTEATEANEVSDSIVLIFAGDKRVILDLVGGNI